MSRTGFDQPTLPFTANPVAGNTHHLWFGLPELPALEWQMNIDLLICWLRNPRDLSIFVVLFIFVDLCRFDNIIINQEYHNIINFVNINSSQKSNYHNSRVDNIIIHAENVLYNWSNSFSTVVLKYDCREAVFFKRSRSLQKQLKIESWWGQADRVESLTIQMGRTSQISQFGGLMMILWEL